MLRPSSCASPRSEGRGHAALGPNAREDASSTQPAPAVPARRLQIDGRPLAVEGTTAARKEEEGVGRAKGRGKGVVCRFYGTKAGCRAGEACPFVHDPAKLKGKQATQQTASDDPEAKSVCPPEGSPAQDRGTEEAKQATVEMEPRKPSSSSVVVDQSRIVPKPRANTQAVNPREFQMNQIRRRFSPKEDAVSGGIALSFRTAPSDPDFPFEMVGLECVLHVPASYPADQPTLGVKNKEMGRGYQINVERGFAALRAKVPQSSLLNTMNALDRQLESLLTEQKAETVKIIGHGSGKRAELPKPETSSSSNFPVRSQAMNASTAPQMYTAEQLASARARRDAETRQLEARLGRLPLFHKSSDGIAYTLPIEPRRRTELPAPLQAVKSIRLFVPLLYPLQSCRIELQGVERAGAAANVEKGFENRVRETSQTNIMGHVNVLAQQMHVFSKEAAKEDKFPAMAEDPNIESLKVTDPSPAISVEPAPSAISDDRSHVTVIPRPVEWTLRREGEHASSDSESDSDSDASEDEADSELLPAIQEAEAAAATTQPERGVLLSFPFLELHSIELLELTALSLTVKCERCKTPTDVQKLRTQPATTPGGGGGGGARSESCPKCASILSLAYRRELMHAHSVRAGYLDLDGCSVVDMLPSAFVPTCASCSTPYPAPGTISVRGEATTTACRECHQRMVFKIPEVKFLLVSSSSAAHANRPPPRKKAKENLGITAGQELPRRGRCAHYAKSYRWFRFSCCGKVYPCDRCHDAAADHPLELAHRMLCGFCSREQNFRPEDCRFCHASLVKTAGSGFWEGGKGTRDPRRMSRKDPRKYKRRGGNAPVGGSGKGK